VGEGAAKLVVLDLDLPGRSGVPLIRELRSTPQTRRIPVIVVMANDADGPGSLQALEAGAAVCCAAPIASFIRLVGQILTGAGRPEGAMCLRCGAPILAGETSLNEHDDWYHLSCWRARS
jgi:DNA-binding NarL/FixJ family response regulator